MSSVPVTTERLYHDLNNERLRVRKQLTKIERHVDFQNIVGSVFADQGYNYELRTNGNFMIIAEAGMSICGKWNGVGWNIYLTVGFGSKIVTDYDVEIEISAAAFADYVPLFNSMIAKLHKLYAAYYESSKANKSSELLLYLVKETLSTLQLKNIKLAYSKEKKGLLQLYKHIVGNLYLSTILDFDNYESRCQEFKMATESVSSLANDEILGAILFRAKGERWQLNEGNSVERHVFDPNIIPKICYDNSGMPQFTEKRLDSDISEVLTNLGYSFTGSYRIKLCKGAYLCRKEMKTWFEHTDINRTSAMDISDEDFKLLLYCIALAIAKQGNFPYVNWDDSGRHGTKFQAFINSILSACLPSQYYIPAFSGSYWKPDPYIKLGDDARMQTGFKWDFSKQNWLSILFYVIKNYDYVKNLPQSLERPEYPNVKTFIRQN